MTRETIASAALARFSTCGYTLTTLRAIADEAEVDPALIIHHFGSKRKLFTAVHQTAAIDVANQSCVPDCSNEQLAAWLAGHFLQRFSVVGSPQQSLLRSAATHDDAAAMLRSLVEDEISPLADDQTEQLRLAIAASILLGVAYGRDLVGISALTSLTTDELIDVVTPTIKTCLNRP